MFVRLDVGDVNVPWVNLMIYEWNLNSKKTTGDAPSIEARRTNRSFFISELAFIQQLQMWAASSPYNSTHLHQQEAQCVNSCNVETGLTPTSRRRNFGPPATTSHPTMVFSFTSLLFFYDFCSIQAPGNLLWSISAFLILFVFDCTAVLETHAYLPHCRINTSSQFMGELNISAL